MRFIGSKANLLDEIDSFINDNINPPKGAVFCDVFAGTASVGKYFKKRFQIISNDALFLSYVLQRASIDNNKKPGFIKLKKELKKDPVDFLNTLDVNKIKFNSEPFILNNYSPVSSENRMYLTEENAKRVDYIRQKANEWIDSKIIHIDEYYYLLAMLVEAVPYVSNITGTYGAYLKHWDKRAFKKLKLEYFGVIDNGFENHSFNENSNTLVENIEGDILYIDPPYNSRQYEANYHLLETVAAYDNPKIYGVTGMRPYRHKKSLYCLKNKAPSALKDLVSKAKFQHIVMSYSSDGIMSEETIRKLLMEVGKPETFKLKRIPYRKYKSKINTHTELFEYLFYVEKEKIWD